MESSGCYPCPTESSLTICQRYFYLFVGMCILVNFVQLEAKEQPYKVDNSTFFLMHFDDSKDILKNSAPYPVKVLSNTTMQGKGKFGKAICFDGVKSKVVIESANIFNLDTSEFTIEAWIKANPDSPPYSGIITKIPFYADSGYTLLLFQGKLRFVFRDKLGIKRDIIGTTDIRDNDWHHIAIVFDGTSVKMYLDGKLERKSSFPATKLSTNNSPVIIGLHPNWTVGKGKKMYFKGVIDELRISNKARKNFPICTNLFPCKSYGFGGLLWPAKWYDSTVYVAKEIPQMIIVPYYNPTEKEIHNVSIILDVPDGFVIESVFRPGKAILGEKLDWLKGMKITTEKFMKGKKSYIRYKIDFASHFVIPPGFATDNSRVVEKKYVSHSGAITLLVCSHLDPGSYPITLSVTGKTLDNPDKQVGNIEKYTLIVLPEPFKVSNSHRFYFGFWQVAWDYSVVPLKVFKRLFEGYSRVGVNVIYIFGSCTKEVANLAKNFGIRILMCEMNPLSKGKNIGRGKEAININGKHLYNMWSPSYFISQSKDVMDSLNEKVRRFVDSGACGIAFDWEGGQGVNISISEYDRVAFIEYLRGRGVNVQKVDWPDDIRIGGRLFDPYWVDFRTDQRAKILRIYIEAVRKKNPDAIFSSYCGFPPFDVAHKQHYLYGYGVDVRKESECVDILSPGNYAGFGLSHKRSLEFIRTVGGAKYAPCLMGGNTYANVPVFSQSKGILPAITSIEAGDVLGLGGRGFIYYQEGRIDGRVLSLFARCVGSIKAVENVLIKGKRIDSLFNVQDFRGYVYTYVFKDKIATFVVPKDVRINTWKAEIILPIEAKGELIISNLSERRQVGILKPGKEVRAILDGKNFTVLLFSSISKQDIISELAGKSITLRFSEHVLSERVKQSFSNDLPKDVSRKRKSNDLDMGFD